MAGESTINDILKLVPHRYPFLLVDRVVEFDGHERLVTFKNVTYNEPFFPGHFPQVPVMPGVLILEALAQTCGLLVSHLTGVRASDGIILYFAGIDKARFKRPVSPGDRLMMEAKVIRHKREIWKFEARAWVDDQTVCTADLMCAAKSVDE